MEEIGGYSKNSISFQINHFFITLGFFDLHHLPHPPISFQELCTTSYG